jgi:hypothetical protein
MTTTTKRLARAASLAALLGVETVVRGTRSRVWLCARSAVLSPLWRALAAGDALFL